MAGCRSTVAPVRPQPDVAVLEFQQKCPHAAPLYQRLRAESGLSDTLVAVMMRKMVKNLESPPVSRAKGRGAPYDDTCCLIGMKRSTIYGLFGKPSYDKAKASYVLPESDTYFYKYWRQGPVYNSAEWSKEIHFYYNVDSTLKHIRYVEWTPWWDESTNGKNRGKKWPTEQNK